MPTAHVNGITVNYLLEGDGEETLVLINGLADDLLSWDFQVPAFLAAGFRVLRFDNRGIGETDKPAGPYTSRLLADDAKALVDHLGITGFHLMGVSMGGMIAQEYALAYGDDLRSLTLACTYAAPDAFCSTMFAMWADLARGLGVPFVMRDVALWAFTGPFFTERAAEAAEFAEAMESLDMSVEAYLSQLNVIQTHSGRVGEIAVPTLVLAGEEDILIPVRLSRTLHESIPGSQWKTVPGGHACLWETPDPYNQAVIEFAGAHAR
jgi:3-oxoadipate enol-lactonase